MDLEYYQEQTEETVIAPMLSYMEGWEEEEDCSYSAENVASCKALLETYLTALDAMTDPTDESIMEQVRVLVLALNDLNEQTDYTLIETEAREAIWAVIQQSAIDCGLQEYSEDITEEWREW